MKKGFTLIELLAVIVILAIIAIITVPMIMNTIEKAKQQSFLDSAYGIIEAGEYFYAEHILNNNETETRYDFEVKNKKFVYQKDNNQILPFKGEVPKTGMLQINNNGKTAIAICNDTYCACKSISELKVTLKDSNCNIDSETGEIGDDLVKDGTPAGMIMSYMGNNVPNGYLACDGSIYNISEYSNLANQIKNEFGSYNYYGGDGETTFAVPDLRGEFLRGTGTATRNTGSGDTVGTHQDATTEIASMAGSNNSLTSKSESGDNCFVTNTDKIISRAKQFYLANSGIMNYTYPGYVVVEYTSRPTNTSVLYCIKY